MVLATEDALTASTTADSIVAFTSCRGLHAAIDATNLLKCCQNVVVPLIRGEHLGGSVDGLSLSANLQPLQIIFLALCCELVETANLDKGLLRSFGLCDSGGCHFIRYHRARHCLTQWLLQIDIDLLVECLLRRRRVNLRKCHI